MPVFSDLRYLCHTEPVQEMIARNRDFIVQFAKTCQLFMCVNPNKRAVTNHVEYETDAWISVFNVTLSLSRVIKVFGEAFVKANASQLVTAIRHVIHVILLVVTLAEDRLDKAKFTSTTFHRVEFGESSYNIVKFDVLEGWVSFHHSLHWLLAELLKHTQLLSPEALTEVGCEDLRGVFLERATEQAVLTIVDFPLRGEFLYVTCFIRVAYAFDSTCYGCANSDGVVGTERVCCPWSAVALPGLYASRVML